MGRKSKVPYELKVINVEEYLKGNKSTLEISVEQFRRWVHKYNVNSRHKYSNEFLLET